MLNSQKYINLLLKLWYNQGIFWGEMQRNTVPQIKMNFYKSAQFIIENIQKT